MTFLHFFSLLKEIGLTISHEGVTVNYLREPTVISESLDFK